jgi:hypothetical protein
VSDAKDLFRSLSTDDPHVFLNFFFRHDVARGTICDPLSERGMLEENDYTGSETAFFLAKWWLNFCKRNHKACRDFQRLPQLPDRIIDVGPSDGSREPHLRETNGVQRACYVTLSHRWGPNLTFTTTRRNISERMRGIPLESMPQTFKDSVKVTRKLDIRYLWIDALCILQDSNSDWEVQAAEMASIYRNSVFTIAADSATDSSSGCFTQRDGYLVRPHELDPPLFDSTDIFKNYIRAHVSGTQSNSTLVKRGWILQETALSARTLIYQKDQLSWRCCTSIASEKHPGMRSIINADFMSQFQQSLLNGKSWLYGEEPSQSSFSTVWRQVLENYTRRSLTRRTDRLAAIYGLAESLRTSCGLTYVAGLWQEQLQKDLLWVQLQPFPGMTIAPQVGRLADAVAPSWSWASIDAPIDFIPGNMEMPVLEGVYIEARVSGSHSCQRGTLTIQSNVRISCTSDDNFLVNSGDHLQEVRWYPDGQIAPSTWIWFIAIARSYPKGIHAHWSAPVGSSSRQPSFEERPHTKWVHVFCLGVVPTMQQPREFRRVGVAAWPSDIFAGDGEDSLEDHDNDVTEGQGLDELEERFSRLDLPEDSDEYQWQQYFDRVGYSYTDCAHLHRRPKRMKLRIV